MLDVEAYFIFSVVLSLPNIYLSSKALILPTYLLPDLVVAQGGICSRDWTTWEGEFKPYQ